MPEHLSKIMRSACPSQIIVGSGVYAQALAQVLGVGPSDLIVEEKISLPSTAVEHDCCSVLTVLSSEDTSANLVRKHRAIWQMLHVRRARWVIVAENAAQAESVRRQDVFGRLDGSETFGKWADRYATVTREEGLAAIGKAIVELTPMWRSVWEGHDAGIQIVAEMLRRIDAAITMQREMGRAALLRDLPGLTWECFCDHTEANRIRFWLARDEKCYAWLQEGRKLLSPLGEAEYSP